MNTIPVDCYPSVVKIVQDCEALLSSIMGNKVSIKLEANDEILSPSDRNKMWLQNQVCIEFEKSWKEIASNDRERSIVNARKAYCFLAYHYLNLSTVEIGKDIRKDHSTVIHSKRKCLAHIQTEEHFANHISNIQKLINENIC